MRDDNTRLLAYCLCCFNRRDNLCHVMPINFLYLPAETVPFLAQIIQWHDFFCIAANLNIITINNGD